MSPWKPIEEMDHDELRRYARDLVHVWVRMPEGPETAEFVKQLDTVGRRMESLGIKPLVTIRDQPL